MMAAKIKYLFLLIIAGSFCSCGNNTSGNADNQQNVVSPVSVTHIQVQALSDYIELNATSVFRKKNVVTANLSGYIKREMITPGQEVHRGQLLFVLETKEAKALGGQVVDSSLHFNGVINIRASKSGYVSQLNHQKGDYVMEGTSLCTIADQSSFVFLLQVPFGLTPYVKVEQHCEVLLSDGQHLVGNITTKNPTVNLVTQTQQFVVRVKSNYHLPENLIAKVKIIKSKVEKANVLPKTALLTDVQESQWWVMKMINDSTAVKIPVQKGIAADSLVQIISPKFSKTDCILVSGNYGLPDTAMVKIISKKNK